MILCGTALDEAAVAAHILKGCLKSRLKKAALLSWLPVMELSLGSCEPKGFAEEEQKALSC